MKPLLPSLCLALLAALAQPATPAHAQSGILLKTLPVEAGKLLLDPVRPQLYATLPADNSLAVIDTDTNTVVTTFFIGSNPADLAISPDGTRLYVANSGSTSAGVGVVDLTSLTVLSSLPTPFEPAAIAAGLGNRLYLVSDDNANSDVYGIAQIDAATGALQGSFGGSISEGFIALQISPDFRTLYGSDEINLDSFDVSTATASLLQQGANSFVGSALTISHNGLYLVDPEDGRQTTLVPASDLNGVIGTFSNGTNPTVATFAADDTKVYQAEYFDAGGHNHLRIFSTETFTQLDDFILPAPGTSTGFPANVTSLAITAPNGYLYLAGTDGTTNNGPGDLMLIGTQSPPFFNGSVTLGGGFSYLQFPDGNLFGYYNFNFTPSLYHSDLGFEYPFDAADGSGGICLYDFTSSDFFYTSPTLFPYLYDFSLHSFLYYYPDTANAGHYTANPRYFFNFATGQTITK